MVEVALGSTDSALNDMCGGQIFRNICFYDLRSWEGTLTGGVLVSKLGTDGVEGPMQCRGRPRNPI